MPFFLLLFAALLVVTDDPQSAVTELAVQYPYQVSNFNLKLHSKPFPVLMPLPS